MHGHDVARAIGGRRHLPGNACAQVFRGLAPLLPHFLDPAANLHARFDVRLRGTPPPGRCSPLPAAQLTVTGAPAAAPRRPAPLDTASAPGRREGRVPLSADPAAFLLVTYGRISPLRPALTGQIVASGPKPWLGFTLPTLFRAP